MPGRTTIYNMSRLSRCLRLLLPALLFAAVCACHDEIDLPQGSCPSGLDAEITLNLDFGKVNVQSRGDIAPGLDKLVTSLWVAVYNKETGLRTGLYSIVRNDNFDNFHDYKTIKLNTLSGPSYIVAVANYDFRYASMDNSGELIPMPEALQAADTWEKYRNIAVAFDADGGLSTSAPLNALMMAGVYTEKPNNDGSMPPLTVVNIAPGMSKPAGGIHLRRLISHVKFNVSFNDANIKSCNIESWQALNMPTHSWLMERPDDDAEPLNSPDLRPADATTYGNSPVSTEVHRDKNVFSFDFWQLENRRTGRTPGDEYTADNVYNYREKEYKTDAGLNTGRYVALVESADSDDPNNMATYVRMQVKMEMAVDENGMPLSESADKISQRMVEATYIVHLGYINKDVTDFNCRRNSVYNYNVTINNVNDLMVEARREGEVTPAVNGFVSDVVDNYHELDAHYNAFNIQLTKSDIESFEYMISAIDINGAAVNYNSAENRVPQATSDDFKYMSWIELRPTTEGVLASYKPRSGRNSDGKTYTLNEVKGKLTAGWYTVFVNEYVYEEGTYANGNEKDSKAWHGYVNRPPRRAWLNVASTVSTDAQAAHYKSKYAISQRSIQTYYLAGSDSGLGVEHFNESVGLNLRNDFNHMNNNTSTASRNKQSGRYNLAWYLSGGNTWRDNRYQWSTFLDVNEPQQVNEINNQSEYRAARTEPLPSIVTRDNQGTYDIYGTYKNYYIETDYDPDQSMNPKYIEAITACLNRNRDLDGDGYIDASELRWFVPVAAQYIRIILGRRSLEHPLMDFAEITRLPNQSNADNQLNSSLLLYASDGQQIWAMEGTSESLWRQWGGPAPWHVRCVRNLGGDMTQINTTNVTTPAFGIRQGTASNIHIIDMTYYDDLSIREEAYHTSDVTMPVHHLTDQRYNRCFRSYEFYDSVLLLSDPRLGLVGKTVNWSEYLAKTNPCKVLDYTGRTGWRVPNQKEMTNIAILGFHTLNHRGADFQLTCTYSYYDSEGYAPGYNPDDPVSTGSLNNVYRKDMKIVTGSGMMTQSNSVYNYTVTSGATQFGIRCVRDVTN